MDPIIRQVDSLVHEMTFTIMAEEVEEQTLSELKTLRKKATIPGFRKGKAPINVLRARYGKDVEEDVRLEVTNRKFQKLMEKESYRILGGGAIKSYKPQENGNLEVVVEFQVEPEIELKKIDQLRVTKEIHSVNEEDLDRVLENMRERHAVIEQVETGAEPNHFVMADFQELDAGGTPIIGRKFEDRHFALGSGLFGELFEEQVKGVKKDDVRNVEVVYPDNEKPGNDKREYYQVTVQRVENKILPDLDDEFATSMGDYQNLDQLKTAVRLQLENELANRGEEQVLENLIDEVIKSNPFDVPPLMVDYYMDTWYEDIKKEAKEKLDENELKERNRPFAIRNIKWYLIRNKLVEKENIEVTDANIKDYIKDIAQKSKVAVTEVEKYYTDPGRSEKLKDQMLEKLVLDRLLRTAKVKEVRGWKRKSNLIETA